MAKVQFIGKVLPDAVKVTVTLPELTWKWSEENVDIKFQIKIGNSVVNAEVEIPAYDQSRHFNELYKRVSDLVKTAVNLVSYSNGWGLVVIIETVIGPDGMPNALLPQDPRLKPLVTAYALDRQPDFARVFEIVATEPPLFRALNDLIESITVAHVACVNCGRVIDSIRRIITPIGTISDKQAWQAMHTALNISAVYQKCVSDQATGPRHGDPSFIPGNIVSEVTHRTWTVMNRFLEYRKRGNQPLVSPEFPLLS
jgi:hypothetical protein